MDPTGAQVKVISELRSTYGRATVKPHAPDRATGILRITLTCMAGEWEWYYDRAGTWLEGALTMRLFDPPPPPHTPHNAIDN